MVEQKKQKTILLVEDDFYVRDIYRAALEERGLKVLEATNGKQAIKIYDSKNVDLVVLDIMLPKVNGVEVLEYMRKKSKKKSDTPTFIITNVADPSIEEEVKKYRPEAYLVKSAVKIRQFVDRIESMLK